ncbi:uncharacterized protein LOC128272078 [Anopheles cruzii]|uniref:uncharacterized protein LOC128272078 n=1 Tax=Anopheles cruzii TaxID=68878 RepID=UPI0022EC30A5|nr:uncharacterized protein LOC128272078 [Anopheles cruzii]
MRCLFEDCVSNKAKQVNTQDVAVRFYPFPVTDYASDQLRRLAKKQLYWWCRTCGVDNTGTLLNQLAICSRHFLRGTSAPLWDVYNPDWVPSLYIPPNKVHRAVPQPNEYGEFIANEQSAEESIANPFWDQKPDTKALRIELIDEIIGYQIGGAYALLDERGDVHRHKVGPCDVSRLPEELKKCLSRDSSLGKLAYAKAARTVRPERMFSANSAVTPVDLATTPRSESERIIMKLQHSVLELINLLNETE